MTGHGAKFPRKMEEAIAALMTRPSVEDAARVVGIEPKTLRRWMREPEFAAAYLKVRRENVSHAIARIQQGCGPAGTTMLKLMVDLTAPHSVRLRAAEAVFDRSIKGVEQEDFEARLAALEAPAPTTKPRR